MSNQNLYKYQFPLRVIEGAGSLVEFKQDAAIVTVELSDGSKFGGVLLVRPRYLAAVHHHSSLPFEPSNIIKIYQTDSDLALRTSSSWDYFLDGDWGVR